MKKLLAILSLAGGLISTSSQGQQEPISTVAMAAAAEAFLSTLTDEQRRQVQYEYDDEAQRARWSNFPTGVVRRGGISLKQMTPAQRGAATQLLATVLSPQGMRKVNEIRQADDDFKANGSRGGPRGAGGGPTERTDAAGGSRRSGARQGLSPDDLFGSDLYFFSILGKPSPAQPWMLQFGGHHLALNMTISGDKGVLTPSLTGAQPATFTVNGQTIRPLGRESDKALALLQSLTDAQRRRAVLDYRVADLVLGPGQDGRTIVPDGLKASDMNATQQAMLLDVIAEWTGIVNASSAAARMAQVKAELGDTWFAWSGSLAGKEGENITAYYRIQGPSLVIEYAPQSDEPSNHVHTMYRDPTNDYGRTLAKQ